jgi:NhaP-type Na+/H+ or K+/H+ antiporter
MYGVGPRGWLWVIFEDNDSTSEKEQTGTHNTGLHGDKHHHLSPQVQLDRGIAQQDNVHPMIRAVSEENRVAPGSRKHTQFGTKRTKKYRNKKKNYKKKEEGKGWGIMDAINNIDKIFLDKQPPELKNLRIDGPDEDDRFLPDDEGDEFLPVVHADDESLPANADELDAYTHLLPASEALECRASVVAFVINATDVKDECDGLRKAFDKTCSVHNQPSGGAPPAAGAGTQRNRRLQELKKDRNKRMLSDWGKPHLWNLIPGAFRREVRKAGGRMVSHYRRRRLGEGTNVMKRSNRTLYEVGGGKAMPLPSTEQRKMEEATQEEPDDAPSVQQEQKQEQAPPLISLNIPTADKHISEQTLHDALLLQQSSDTKPMKASATSLDTQAPQQPVQLTPPLEAQSQHDEQSQDVIPAMVNPNITAESAEAIQDAAESSAAIRNAVDGVKSSMNDPKSIEARTCCASILSVFHEHCDPTTTGVEDYSDRRLLVVVFVITVCGMVKSLIRHLHIRWLPEAGGCILVGVFGYLILQHMPHVQFAFDGDMFLRIMVPPIVFEAAVKINKHSFRRHVVPIIFFAIVGTLASTAFTAFLLHNGSKAIRYVTTIPIRESLIFGALISSIDPIAVLSILNNMGMTDSDTIYVLIFGESLLNDGVAIVLFQTLVHFLDETLVIDGDVVLDAVMHFVVVALGSIIVGMASGACATIYFAMMHGCQTPMVEVIMFCCWSFIPYYICDMVEWSGIVAIVANGFVMDLYVIGQKQQHGGNSSGSADIDDEINFLVNGTGGNSGNSGNSSRARRYRQQQCRSIFSYEGHLSQKADSHVHFVIEIFATLMETAIFAYLGLFLFSPRYHWSGTLTIISIFATVAGRVIMIPLFSHVANIFNRWSLSKNRSPGGTPNNEQQGVHIDRRMQLVLIFAGLRGAMSFALVEHIPMFDTTTGQGSRFKPELKAMTSASVIFTVFVLGGATSYLMEKLGYSFGKQQQTADDIEISTLIQQHEKKIKSPPSNTQNRKNNNLQRGNSSGSSNNSESGLGSMRQRGPR